MTDFKKSIYILFLVFSLFFIEKTTTNTSENIKTNDIKYDCTNEQKEVIQDYLSLNDEKYIDYFKELNGRIIVEEVHYSLSGNDCGGEIVKRGNDCTIYLCERDIEYALNHEFGHLVDCYGGKWSLSSTDEFWEIYLEEKDFFNEYNAGSTNECFAQAYKLYIEHDYYFKRDCPLMYDYLDKNV